MSRRQESRMDSLYAGHVAALRELEGAQAERRAAEAGWAQARAQVDQMSSGTAIEAPFAGVVVRRHADVGATAGPGQPLLDIRSDVAGEITVDVPESELARLASGGAQAQVGDGEWRAATLVRVDGMTDFTTRSRVARFRFANGAAPEPGAFARVRLAGGGRAADPRTPGTLSVPAGALVRRGGLTGVYVADAGVARLRWLRIGRERSEGVEVLAGLAAGDDVVVAPAGLEDGRSLRVTR
jgi:RND family efflux transporter MFP subunit